MKPILTLLFIFSVIYAYSQEYQVLHVKGDIILEKDGSLLKSGDKISEKDKIRFKSKDAMAAVLNKEKGRYIIKATSESTDENDLFYIIKSTISPVRGGMSSRAAGINNDIDFQLYFAEAPYVWAGNTLKIAVSPAAYPMNEKRFFYIEYSYGGDWIGKKLNFENEFIIVEKKLLFSIDENQIDPDKVTDYTLYYYDAISEESKRITDIDFVLISQEELQQIANQFPVNNDSYYEIADVLSNIYGKCDPLQLEHNIKR